MHSNSFLCGSFQDDLCDLWQELRKVDFCDGGSHAEKLAKSCTNNLNVNTWNSSAEMQGLHMCLAFLDLEMGLKTKRTENS